METSENRLFSIRREFQTFPNISKLFLFWITRVTELKPQEIAINLLFNIFYTTDGNISISFLLY